MGTSIAIALAQFFDVHIICRDLEKSQRLLNLAIKTYTRLKGAAAKPLNQIGLSDSPLSMRDAALVIEAVTEEREAKIAALRAAADFLPAQAVVASSTSTLSITDLGESVEWPQRFFGCHFFNPAYSIPIVELSLGEKSAPTLVGGLSGWLQEAGFAVVTLEEKPGLIVNRALFLMINEAIDILAEKMAAPGDIDNLFERALGHPMGPLRLADFIGLDTCESILNNLFNEFKQSKYRPSVLLSRKVRAGKLGRKSREGFYHYGRKA
jgi:3-hydroxybutyryl-CoA dehydrogenase